MISLKTVDGLFQDRVSVRRWFYQFQQDSFFFQYTVIYGANVRLFLIFIMKNDIIIVVFEDPFFAAYHINALFTAP